MKEKVLFFFGAAILLLVVSLMIGGIYTVTPPNGAVDTAYKVNRFTGKVWLIKTYDKQVGALRVLAAREAAVEPTKELNDDVNLPAVATQADQESTRTTGRKR
jgi:hypothetical protein